MDAHLILLSVGGILLASLVADTIGHRTVFPRVTLLVLIGIAAGPFGLNLIPEPVREMTDLVAVFALSMVAFLLGGDLSREKIAGHGREILIVSAFVVLITAFAIGSGLWLLGVSLPLVLLLAATATATAPAATRDVVMEAKAKGSFKVVLLGVVAIDDAWGLIIFGFAVALAGTILGNGSSTLASDLSWDLGGAVLVGSIVGLPAAYLSGRIRSGQPSQIEALGIVSLCGGMALWLGVSYLLAAMVTGILTANFAKHHVYSFREIEQFEWPFLVFFFVLAGATLDLRAVLASGTIGAAYIALRILGRIMGGMIGGQVAGLPGTHKRWIGLALMPQAGIALGMALVAAREFPDLGTSLVAIVVGGTMFFEIIGPIVTRIALRRTEIEP
jgi:Kef-type K+ transport system membrane component KefB